MERLAETTGALLKALPAENPPAKVPEQARRAGAHRYLYPRRGLLRNKVFAAPPYDDPLSAALFVLARQLSNGYLYRHIRFQGGAYGGSCRYEPLGGLFAFLFYRDPHLTETLAVYRDAVDSALQNPIAQEELEKAVIGSIGTGQAAGPRRQGIHRPDPGILRPERFRPASFPERGAQCHPGTPAGNRPALFSNGLGSGGGCRLRGGGPPAEGQRNPEGEINAGKTDMRKPLSLAKRRIMG